MHNMIFRKILSPRVNITVIVQKPDEIRGSHPVDIRRISTAVI